MPTNYQVIDYSQETTGIVHENSHITLYVTYKYNNTPVWVSNPSFSLKRGGTAVSLLYLLRPIQKSERGNIGEYIVTFLSNGLSSGTYTANFTGKYNTHNLTGGGSFELKETIRAQWFIDSLKTALGTTYGLQVPSQYVMFDPKKHFWEDGKLYNFLQLALNDTNQTPPLMDTDFTLDSVPITGILLLGAEIYALSSISAFEIGQFFDINVPMRVNLYKGDKYQSLMRDIKDRYTDPLKKWKYSYNMSNLQVVGISQTRIPYRVLRPLCVTTYTPIQTLKGLVPMGEINIGEQISTKDGMDIVKRKFKVYLKRAMKTVLNNNKIFHTGFTHRFFTEDGWKEVYRLKKGDEILTETDKLKIKSIEDVKANDFFYDIETEKYHNYLIGEEKIISHNSQVLHYSSLFPY